MFTLNFYAIIVDKSYHEIAFNFNMCNDHRILESYIYNVKFK